MNEQDDPMKKMLQTLYDEEAILQKELIKTRQNLNSIEVNLHRTQGAIQVLEKLSIPQEN